MITTLKKIQKLIALFTIHALKTQYQQNNFTNHAYQLNLHSLKGKFFLWNQNTLHYYRIME